MLHAIWNDAKLDGKLRNQVIGIIITQFTTVGGKTIIVQLFLVEFVCL